MAAISTDAHVPTREEILDDVRAVTPNFRERAVAAEDARQLPPESIAEMLDVGLARILVPRRFGGYELGLRTWFETVLEIAKADASHGWCASLMIHHPHYVAQFSEQAQQSVWADGPDVVVAASIMPVCEVIAEDGGYRITGRSPFTSGVTASKWAIVGGFLPYPQPKQWCLFLVESSQYEIEDTWFTTGMQGTGSNTVVTDGAFVPETHVLKQTDLRDGVGPGGVVNQGAIYRAPWYSYAPLTFVTPMLGAAQGAYESFTAWTAQRKAAGGAAVADFPSVQIRLGQAAASLDAAELLLRRAAATVENEPVTAHLKARNIRDYARATELTRDAADTLMQMCGTAGFAADNAIHRAWHNIHFAASHVSLNADANFAYWSREELGRNHPDTVAF